jgi:hypothetical protein
VSLTRKVINYEPLEASGTRRPRRPVRSPPVGYEAHLYEGPLFVFPLNMNKVCFLSFLYFYVL